MFRIAKLFLNKQEERPFISNSFQTARVFFSLCVPDCFPHRAMEGAAHSPYPSVHTEQAGAHGSIPMATSKLM